MPTKNKPSVHVVGGGPTEELFVDRGYELTNKPYTANILVFTNGPDLSPERYGSKPISETKPPDRDREKDEINLIRKHPYKFKVGFGRGAHLLHVANGGKLWQHVNNHDNIHLMFSHDHPQGIPVASYHHQLMYPLSSATLVGWSYESNIFKTHGYSMKLPPNTRMPDNPVSLNNMKDAEPEILWHNPTRSLCFQPRPDKGLVPCTNLFFDYIEDLR